MESITVESTPGEGSTFSVTLPRSYPRTLEDADDPEEPWTLEPGKTPVLVVEDDAADAFALKRILADTQLSAVWARSIRQAQQILEQAHPAVILLDVVLGGDESWRLLLQLRQQEAHADIPLVVMSSSARNERRFTWAPMNMSRSRWIATLLIGLLDRLTGRRTITKVLLVDDEEITRYLVRQLLPRSRYALNVASNGEEGLQRLRDEPSGRGFTGRQHAGDEWLPIS